MPTPRLPQHLPRRRIPAPRSTPRWLNPAPVWIWISGKRVRPSLATGLNSRGSTTHCPMSRCRLPCTYGAPGPSGRAGAPAQRCRHARSGRRRSQSALPGRRCGGTAVPVSRRTPVTRSRRGSAGHAQRLCCRPCNTRIATAKQWVRYMAAATAVESGRPLRPALAGCLLAGRSILGQQDPQHALDEARTVLECFADEASARVFWGSSARERSTKCRCGPRPKRGNMRPRACRRGRNPFAWSMPAPTTATRSRLRTKWHKDRAKPLFRTGSGQLRSVAGRALRRRRHDVLAAGPFRSNKVAALPCRERHRKPCQRRRRHDHPVRGARRNGAALPGHAPENGYRRRRTRRAARCRKVDCTLRMRNGHLGISHPGSPRKVPLLMHRQAPHHPLFLRAHAYGGFETVAYALPPEVASHLRTAAAHGGGHAIR